MPRRPLTVLALGLCAAKPYEAPARITIKSSSDCPSASQVSEVLAPLLPNTVLESPATGSEGASSVEIRDLGAGFSVRVHDHQRAFEDAARSCSERARLAAVFIGLVLAPPLAAREPEQSRAEPAAPPPVPGPAPA